MRFDDYVSERQYSLVNKTGAKIYPGGRLAAMANQQALINMGVQAKMIPAQIGGTGPALAYNAFDSWKKRRDQSGMGPEFGAGIF